jgi:hypothetical protein
LLDEIVLERQRFHHRVGDDHLEGRDLVEQGIVTGAHAPGAQVASHPVAERAGLADVHGVAGPITPQIHARLLREAGDLLLEVLDGHGLV